MRAKRSTVRASAPFALVVTVFAAAAAPARASAQQGAADPAAPGTETWRRHDIAVAHADGSRSTLPVYVPDGGGARPTVVFFHGLWAGPRHYTSYAENLASRGYVAALFDQHDRDDGDLAAWVAAGRSTLDVIARSNADPRSPLFGRCDPDRIATMGHSYGGMTAIGLAATDVRVRAAVALAPGAAERGLLLQYARFVAVPTLVITGRWDFVAWPSRFGRSAWDEMPTPDKLYLKLSDASHLDFADRGLFPWSNTSAERRTARRYANAWLDRWLLGAADPQGFTDGRHADRDREVSEVRVPAPPSTFAVTVTGSAADVRRGPSTAYPLVGRLRQGSVVTALQERSGWYRVTWNGAPPDELWVPTSQVRRR